MCYQDLGFGMTAEKPEGNEPKSSKTQDFTLLKLRFRKRGRHLSFYGGISPNSVFRKRGKFASSFNYPLLRRVRDPIFRKGQGIQQ